MNEKENKNLLYAMQSLGAVLEDKDYTIRAKQFRINELEQQVNELTAKLVNECGSEEQYESTIKAQKEHIDFLNAKIYDLEERIAIMTETEAPKHTCVDISSISQNPYQIPSERMSHNDEDLYTMQ